MFLEFLQNLWIVVCYGGCVMIGLFACLLVGIIAAVLCDVVVDLLAYGKGIQVNAARQVRPLSVVFGLLVIVVCVSAALLTVAKRFGVF